MKWKDIKVGDVLKDGSVVTQIHRTHSEDSCKVIYDNDRELICSYNHIFLIDVSNLPEQGKVELDSLCKEVPLVEDYHVISKELTPEENDIVLKYCHNEPVDVQVEVVVRQNELEILDFHFKDGVKRVQVVTVVLQSEPQKVDDNTFWLTCRGIEYLMNTYKVDLYCNGLIINKIIPMGQLPCFCISTDTGRYET